MALTADIDRTENRDFHLDNAYMEQHFIDLTRNFLHPNEINSKQFEKVVLMFSNEFQKSSIDWFLARLNDKRTTSQLHSVKINIIDYNSSCERCGKKLPPTIPWLNSTKLCKACEEALDDAYGHHLPWIFHSNHNNNWTTFTSVLAPLPIRTPFADWF